MKIYYDKFKQPTPPKIYLGTSNNKVLCAVNGIDESTFALTMNLTDTWTVTFDMYRYIQITDADGRTREIESNVYLLINHLMRLYIENIGWFIIEPPEINHDGYKETKTITAQSCEIEMQQHDLKLFKINQGTTDSYEMLAKDNVEIIDDVEFAKEQIKFYNPDNAELSLLDLAMKAAGLNGWSVGYIDEIPKEYQYYEDGELKTRTTKLADEIGAFNLDSENLYAFFTQDAAKYFECIFVFDFKNMKINAYHPENLGKDTNINIGFRNLQQENSITVDDSSIFTRYYVQGSDDLGITYVNFGDNYIEDVSYFLNEKYLSEELIEKYKLWSSDCEFYRTQYIEQTRLYNKQMNVISELHNRVPLDDCSTDWSTFEDDKLLEAQANYQAQLKGYEQFYVDKDGNFDEEALKNSVDANDYYQIRDVILPSIQIEIENRKLPTDDDKADYIDSYKTDWKLYGLDELQVNLDSYQNVIDICEKNGYDVPYSDESGHTKDTHDTMYAKYEDAKNQLDGTREGSCQWFYNKVKAEIDDATALLNSYDEARKNAAKNIDKKQWSSTVGNKEYSFTSDDLSDLSKLYIDGDYTNDNMFLVDSDDQVTAIDEQLKLLTAAQDDLYSTSHPQYTYTTKLDNFLAHYDYKNYTDNLNVGDYIHIAERDDYVVKLRVVSIACNLLAMNNDLTIEFSNMIQSRYKRSDEVYLLDMASGGSKNSASGSSDNFLNNEGVTLTAGLIQKLLATGAFSNKVSQIVNNEFAGVIAGGSGGISVGELNKKMLQVTDITGENGFFQYLQSKLISAGMIKADSAEFTDLSALVANIKNVIIGTSYTETGIMINLTAENATMSEAFIKNLMAQYITVNELKASDIITDKIKILSADGKLKIEGNTFTIYDEDDNPVIQLGQDKNGKYGLIISDENGAILLDSQGLHEGIVPDQFIKNVMIEDGTIGKEKVNFEFLEPNEYGGLDAGKVTVNGKGIDVEFTTIKNTVEQLDKKVDSIEQESGKNAVLFQIYSPDGNVILNDKNNVTLKTILTDGDLVVNDGISYQWYVYKEGSYVLIDGTIDDSYLVIPSMVESCATFKCTANYNDKFYDAFATVIDKNDPIEIKLVSSIGTQIINGSGVVGAVYALVYQNNEEIDSIKTTTFLEISPTDAKEGDYFYKLNKESKTVTLMKYENNQWINAPTSDLPLGEYKWYRTDKNGKSMDESSPFKFGKVIYIDETFIDTNLNLTCIYDTQKQYELLDSDGNKIVDENNNTIILI